MFFRNYKKKLFFPNPKEISPEISRILLKPPTKKLNLPCSGEKAGARARVRARFRARARDRAVGGLERGRGASLDWRGKILRRQIKKPSGLELNSRFYIIPRNPAFVLGPKNRLFYLTTFK